MSLIVPVIAVFDVTALPGGTVWMTGLVTFSVVNRSGDPFRQVNTRTRVVPGPTSSGIANAPWRVALALNRGLFCPSTSTWTRVPGGAWPERMMEPLASGMNATSIQWCARIARVVGNSRRTGCESASGIAIGSTRTLAAASPTCRPSARSNRFSSVSSASAGSAFAWRSLPARAAESSRMKCGTLTRAFPA